MYVCMYVCMDHRCAGNYPARFSQPPTKESGAACQDPSSRDTNLLSGRYLRDIAQPSRADVLGTV